MQYYHCQLPCKGLKDTQEGGSRSASNRGVGPVYQWQRGSTRAGSEPGVLRTCEQCGNCTYRDSGQENSLPVLWLEVRFPTHPEVSRLLTLWLKESTLLKGGKP